MFFMMKKIILQGFYCIVFLGCFWVSICQGVTYINISNPLLKKSPVAVPDFKTMGQSTEEAKYGKAAVQTLSEALNFTGYLKTMDPVAFLANPSKTGIQLSEINFRDWKGIGADYLITGGVLDESPGNIKFELRFFDAINSKLLVGKVYTGPESQIRKMMHMFCNEIAFILTGKYGVFGTEIAFVSTVDGNKEIFTCDFDGQNVKQITSHKNITLSPSWSSDGKWLAYVSYAKGKPDIYIKNLLENRVNIIDFKGMNISPDWMPGQQKIAAALSFSGDQEIYLLTINGEVIKRLTDSLGIDVSPKFSPDGQKIAFTSKRAGTPQIFVQDIGSGSVKRLTFNGLNNTSPAWSPDGKKIAYVGIEKNNIDIFVMSIDSGGPVQLTADSGDNEDPVWSPDGSMLAFTSTREGGVPRIFVMNASGTDQRRLLNMSGKQTQPDWSISDSTKEGM
jgi:TolB protein